MATSDTAGSQLVLDLGHRAAFGREDFWLGAGNKEAVEWIDRWPAWPGRALALFGPTGCGKSHLAQVFALKAGARVLPASAIGRDSVAAIVDAAGALVIEQDDDVAEPQALLHVLNAVQERGGYILLTSREAPARWAVALPDLRSRLAAMPAVRIAAPDDAMIEAVLVKLFNDRQLAVGPEVIAYVVRRMDRSFAAMRSLVARADAAALSEKRPISVALVKALVD